jgi:hypothetical protein
LNRSFDLFGSHHLRLVARLTGQPLEKELRSLFLAGKVVLEADGLTLVEGFKLSIAFEAVQGFCGSVNWTAAPIGD